MRSAWSAINISLLRSDGSLHLLRKASIKTASLNYGTASCSDRRGRAAGLLITVVGTASNFAPSRARTPRGVSRAINISLLPERWLSHFLSEASTNQLHEFLEINNP